MAFYHAPLFIMYKFNHAEPIRRNAFPELNQKKDGGNK